MRYSIILILLCLPTLLCAQEFQFRQEFDTIPVEIDGWRPFVPWMGGIQESAPDFVDIDGDGGLDLFIGNSSGTIYYLINIGTAVTPNFSFISYKFENVNLGNSTYAGHTSPEFCDIDNDGDMDWFSGDFRGLIHFWRNIGTVQNFQFQFVTDTLANIDADGYSKFDFKDIDMDGDYDLILGDYFGFVWLYWNTGTPLNYNFSTPPVQLVGVSVGQNGSPCLVDIDADGDYDLFIGNQTGHVYFYRNDGTPQQYNFTFVTNNYNNIDVGAYASPEFADIDGDGDYDLFVGSENQNQHNPGDILFYRNIGTPQTPQWQFVTTNYLSLDEGGGAHNASTDINADSTYDMFLAFAGTLSYYRNIGTPASPYFRWITSNYQNINVSDNLPYFCDIDHDGDPDLYCGSTVIPNPPYPGLYYFKNIGTPQNASFTLISNNLVPYNYYVGITPSLADINADGDDDIFLSDVSGTFFYCQNTGTPTQPSFAAPVPNWQGIHGINGEPTYFYDIDSDGDLDLFQGIGWDGYFNHLVFYRNTGTAQIPNLVLEDSTFLHISEGEFLFDGIDIKDIDGDGDGDIFLGTMFKGGVLFFRNITGESPVNITLTPAQPPITIPASGGNFRYNITISNQGSATQNTDFWVMVQLPNGSWYGPMYGPVNRNISPGVNISRNRNQSIPARAPAGTYHYEGRVGVYPDTVWARSSFTLEKQGDSGQTGITMEGWENWGEEWGEPVQDNQGAGKAPLQLDVSPNPANPTTTIRFTVPTAGHIRVSVFDISGRLVATLTDGKRAAGTQEVVFDASQQASGVYLIRLDAGQQRIMQKVVVVK